MQLQGNDSRITTFLLIKVSAFGCRHTVDLVDEMEIVSRTEYSFQSSCKSSIEFQLSRLQSQLALTELAVFLMSSVFCPRLASIPKRSP